MRNEGGWNPQELIIKLNVIFLMRQDKIDLFPRRVFKNSGLSSGPSLGPTSSGLNSQYQPQPVGEGENILEFPHNQTRNVLIRALIMCR